MKNDLLFFQYNDLVGNIADEGELFQQLVNGDEGGHALRETVLGGKAEIEISGNVDEAKVEMIRDLKVDYVSSGALTHSSPILDLSLKNMRRV